MLFFEKAKKKSLVPSLSQLLHLPTRHELGIEKGSYAGLGQGACDALPRLHCSLELLFFNEFAGAHDAQKIFNRLWAFIVCHRIQLSWKVRLPDRSGTGHRSNSMACILKKGK